MISESRIDQIIKEAIDETVVSQFTIRKARKPTHFSRGMNC